MAASVICPGASGIRYGVSGSFERWSGEQWVPRGSWIVSLDFWGGFPEIVPAGQLVTIPAIALSAPAHGIGPVGYFRLQGLVEGWYRIVLPGRNICGLLRVVTDAPLPVPISNPRRATLIAAPTLMRTGGTVGIVGQLMGMGTTTSGDVQRFNESLSDSVVLMRWSNSGWNELITLATTGATTTPYAHPQEVSIQLPDLSEGVYKLVRSSRDHGDLSRVIWVDSSIPD